MTGEPDQTGHSAGISSFAALGDSFTAGNGCDPRERWPDLIADGLRASNPGLRYLNLARDGATSDEVRGQVEGAIEFGPDLVTIICGANDVILSPRPDILAFQVRFSSMLDRLMDARPGATVLTSTYPEQWQLKGVGPRTRSRMQTGMAGLNEAIRSVAASRAVPCLDVVDHPAIQDPSNYQADGLHPSAAGHRQAANELRKAIESI